MDSRTAVSLSSPRNLTDILNEYNHQLSRMHAELNRLNEMVYTLSGVFIDQPAPDEKSGPLSPTPVLSLLEELNLANNTAARHLARLSNGLDLLSSILKA
jgi:hypothetical protein